MKIIISPAKKMIRKEEKPVAVTRPVFYKEAEYLRNLMRQKDFEELKKLWRCNEKIAKQNIERLKELDMDKNLTPAVLAYEGIQYQYMAPQVFTDMQWEYVKRNLRILSGLYGVLKPQDGVIPYRLEMQAKLETEQGKDLYQFWGRKLARELTGEDSVILNLASKEYSAAVEKYLEKDVIFLNCVFGEVVQGKIKVKGTKAKMARGEMVRFLSENQIENPEEIRQFQGLGYRWSQEHSSEKEFVFLLS